jgi:hypothetical protein
MNRCVKQPNGICICTNYFSNATVEGLGCDFFASNYDREVEYCRYLDLSRLSWRCLCPKAQQSSENSDIDMTDKEYKNRLDEQSF